ncbi:hypothetical protein [Effusibacillus pohliae]|uniref:hypothetical protein n=1 Tax=Effusibacillus pohliae TaxID=232270 RepID=UPI000369E387|nr:hypothetical protein [Effusibacillus pohliae]
MPVGIWFGFLKSYNVTQGGSVSLGVNIVQNRNSTKQNNGNLAITAGVLSIPTFQLVNLDIDVQDLLSYDHTNWAGSQW